MEAGRLAEGLLEGKEIRIIGSELVENYTLTAGKKIDKNLLPPKKIIGKNSKTFVEKRQKELEVYLQTLLTKFPFAAPKVLSHFLHFDLYEVNGITAALAEQLFHKGEQLLLAGEAFCLRPLQLYAITQQLRLASPTCASGDAKTDLGHVLDFACRLKYLKISGTRGSVGDSNIQEHLLKFDLSIFKSVHQIEISNCEAQQIIGLPSLKNSLATMTVSFSTASMKDILVPEASEFEQWEVEGMASERPVAAIIPRWNMLTTLDMSHNQISNIDESVRLIPKVEFLDLSYNEITVVENLQHLYNLIHLDLSFNKLTLLQGVHTKLGNIKTLNLSGNQLESLSGLNKLYSLVNLDLGDNKISQIEEIKNIGSLPCLEKVFLNNNPLSIIPDYRTKILAQFGDRASEVCLDNTVTTGKELDTVEVLKAIQKAKEAKDRMNSTDKKISEETRLAAQGSKPSYSSYVACPPSPLLHHAASSSQEINTKSALIINLHQSESLTPMASTITPGASDTANLNGSKSKVANAELKSMKNSLEDSDCLQTRFGSADASTQADVLKSLHDPEVTLVLPFSCVSYNTTNLDFAAHLSGIINQALLKLHTTETLFDCQGNPVNYPEVFSNEAGYFEMGPDEGDCILGCSSNIDLSSISANLEAEILKVLWTLCIQVNKGLRLFVSCIVLTDSAVAVFQIPHSELLGNMQNVISQMQLVLCLPYSEILEVFFEVPEMCLSMKIKTHGCFFFVSDSQNLKDFNTCLKAILHKWSTSNLPILDYEETLMEDFIVQLLQHQQLALHDTGINGCFAAYILISDNVKPWDWSEELNPSISHEVVSGTELKNKNTLHSEICSVVLPGKEENSKPVCVPCLLVLTAQHLYFVRIDFYIAAKKCLHPEEIAKCPFKLNRISLATLLLNPKQGSHTVETVAFWDGHILEFLIGYQLATAVFVLPHEKFHFLRMFTQLRASFQGVKSIIVHRTCPDHCYLTKHSTDTTDHSPEPESNQPKFKSDLSLSLQYPSETLLQKLTEENQCPFHLSASLSLHYLAGLKGRAIVECFHNSIAEVENEELRHLIWSSVIFYKSSELEVTACIMLSTKALYFVLDDAIIKLADQTGYWNENPSSNSEQRGLLLSFCFVLKLNDLQSIHLGLFDQYFRITGPSAEHTIACLTRDSYTTHTFVQQLMAVLSLLERTPSPEPVELDFYTEFGKKSTGQMENYEIVHSSRVKFIYPSEEEVGDLTFMIAENVQELNLQTSNILLYVLAFQVESLENPLHSCKCSLQPKTLILTSYDMLLFEEDYVSYPLPEFAKEPPQRDKYQLTDARRIRDLDRVLMGYQTYPQAITFVFDDVHNRDLLSNMMLDHFEHPLNACSTDRRNHCNTSNEVQWCLFVASPESRERLIALLARQWELLCGRELPVELTG
ncbi:nischarin isoform X2 [Pristis pectinata]|uniref:nischarin isoform X2 n=1 Tax=Pristis pectinata TaxID=685728 RepID=UPI00223D7101|nr:nischarin isoform X2 [Pristis pectinata]